MRSYYSKIQQRFVDRGEYFDELLFATLEPPFDKPITNEIRNTNDNNNKFYWVKEDLNKDLFLPQVFNALDQVNNNNDFTYNP